MLGAYWVVKKRLLSADMPSPMAAKRRSRFSFFRSFSNSSLVGSLYGSIAANMSAYDIADFFLLSCGSVSTAAASLSLPTSPLLPVAVVEVVVLPVAEEGVVVCTLGVNTGDFSGVCPFCSRLKFRKSSATLPVLAGVGVFCACCCLCCSTTLMAACVGSVASAVVTGFLA